MPDLESTRKRSRSPDDSDHKTHKRPNTGAPVVHGSNPNNSGPASDINMAEQSQHAQHDASSSAPLKRDDSDHKAPQGDSGDSKDAATTSGEPSSTTSTAAPSANIHMRCLIVTQDASIIIGKGGSHVNEIREKSGARVMVSESIPGNPERILNVSGPLDAVSKVISRPHLLSRCYVLMFTVFFPFHRPLVSLCAGLTMSRSTCPPYPAVGQSPSNS